MKTDYLSIGSGRHDDLDPQPGEHPPPVATAQGWSRLPRQRAQIPQGQEFRPQCPDHRGLGQLYRGGKTFLILVCEASVS